MMKRALWMIAGAALALGACADEADEGDDLSPEDLAAWDAAFGEATDGKTDNLSCSGVKVPDRRGFDKRVALTFDDGPNPATTPQVLDVLAEHGIKATFFINGRRVVGDTERAILKRIVDEGHILANHSHEHKNLKTVSQRTLDEQIRLTDNIIRASEVEPEFFRFPFGSSSCATAAHVRSYGYKITGWHIDSADWCFASSKGGVGHCATSTFRHVPDSFRDDMVGFTLSQARSQGGGILLFHDIHQNTANAISPIIEKLKGEGFTFTSLDDTETFPLLNGVEPEPQPFFGDACGADADCQIPEADGAGTCFGFAQENREEVFGFCTSKCEGFCPDRFDKVGSFCASLDEGVSGSCLLKATGDNADCALVAGTKPAEVARFIGASTASPSTATVCLP